MKRKLNINLYKNDRLEEEYKDIPSIVDKDSYKFKINNIKTIINNNSLQRETEEYKFKLDFLNNNASFLLKEYQQTLPIEVEQLTIDKQDKHLTIIYKIASDEEIFKIYIEEKDDKNE